MVGSNSSSMRESPMPATVNLVKNIAGKSLALLGELATAMAERQKERRLQNGSHLNHELSS